MPRCLTHRNSARKSNARCVKCVSITAARRRKRTKVANSMCDNNQLNDILTQRISRQGRITFADFMAACLYEPGLGYYTSPGRKVGVEGDFYTSISVHAAFGRVIARQIAQMWRSMGALAGFTLVECGAG